MEHKYHNFPRSFSSVWGGDFSLMRLLEGAMCRSSHNNCPDMPGRLAPFVPESPEQSGPPFNTFGSLHTFRFLAINDPHDPPALC
jgi:hypothetical protein